jgi:hypothetical protein
MFTSLKQSHSERVSLRQLCFLFLVVIDNAIASFTQRFQQMQEFQTSFGFLFESVRNRSTIDETAFNITHAAMRNEATSSRNES